MTRSLVFSQIGGGKKPKRGPFNGYSHILIGDGNEASNYGFRNKKCIKVFSHQVRKISGVFENDVLQVSLFNNALQVLYESNSRFLHLVQKLAKKESSCLS